MASSDSIVRILKSVIHGRRPADDIKKAGQPYVNFADMQFGVIDPKGVHQDLLPIRFWAAGTTYAIKDMVAYNGGLYKCKTANHDATWQIAHWTVETDIVVSWANVAGKPTTFPINAAATALITAAKKAGDQGIHDASLVKALTVVNKTAIATAKADIVVAQTQADKGVHNARTALNASNTNKTNIAAHIAKTTGVHGATNLARANTIVQRDAHGGAHFSILSSSPATITAATFILGGNFAGGDSYISKLTIANLRTLMKIPTAINGARGLTGPKGATGAAGPALAVSHTVHATTGNPSIARSGNTLTFTLKTGATGGRGATGAKGATGATGHIGTPGKAGARGATGAAGAKAVVRGGHAAPTGGHTGDLYIQY